MEQTLDKSMSMKKEIIEKCTAKSKDSCLKRRLMEEILNRKRLRFTFIEQFKMKVLPFFCCCRGYKNVKQRKALFSKAQEKIDCSFDALSLFKNLS